jgi:hypothetical protein
MTSLLKKFFPLKLRRYIRDLLVTLYWYKNGCEGNPPNWLKRRMVRECLVRFKIKTFVETGTFLGEMVYFLRDDCERIFSIELSSDLAFRAQKYFLKWPHISILEGDSASFLPGLVQRISQPALFWLDGHFSSGETACGSAVTPILDELECILNTLKTPYIILIDDARLFSGKDGYPSFQTIKEKILIHQPGARIDIFQDTIRVINIPF